MADSYSITVNGPLTDSFNDAITLNDSIAPDRESESSSSRSIRTIAPPTQDAPHVDYILVAEFSIDKGSIMEHQYPNPISGDEKLGHWWRDGKVMR